MNSSLFLHNFSLIRIYNEKPVDNVYVRLLQLSVKLTRIK
ncbi:hypothetical protein SRABI133_01701 [Peribacillus simplex]|jgi:hypothetical protein|uniref:Uncharacterized protein n=1 Tax=Peribacillus simplex TaxID=1478 RepID=A0A9W4PBZ2_9BACI|nr:hypothetical protein SRABI133_01701 [Peribacillus simplex]